MNRPFVAKLSTCSLALLFLALPLSAAEHPGYIDAPERRTTGIGKFYMGR